MRIARSGARALRPPQMVRLKWQDRAAGSNQSLRVASCKSPSQDEWFATSNVQSVPRNGIPQNVVSEAHISSPQAMNTRGTFHERCGPGGWPGPHFICSASCKRLNLYRLRPEGSARL